MMGNRPKNPANARNKNVLVVGGSGSGKTRFWLKPNLLQCHSSYVVTDPKGDIVIDCGQALLKNGYSIRIFNTINFRKSMHYNPFAYIHSEKDILKLTTTLIANTKGDGKAGDEFWTKAETLLYCALIGYIHYEAPLEEQNFATLIEFLNAMEVREDDETFQNPVDQMFEALKKKKPNHFAVRQYAKFKLAAGKTLKSILVSCGARLAPFDIEEVRDITMYDELSLDTVGDKKTALFLIMSDTDPTFNFLISMIYGRMVEIYLMVSLAPIPFATFGNHEQSHTGQNYLRSLFALGFQGFLIMICVGIYAVLIQNLSFSDNIISSIWGVLGYTVLLAFTLFKTGSLAKSVFAAH